MGVSTYLMVSRHNVYYLCWPLPQSLHPLGKVSDIKVTLRRRDRREALHLSRRLAYVAETCCGGYRAVLTKRMPRLYFDGSLRG